MTMTKQIELIEVGPRDGCRTSPPITTEDKVTLVNLLSEAGFLTIEVTSHSPNGCHSLLMRIR